MLIHFLNQTHAKYARNFYKTAHGTVRAPYCQTLIRTRSVTSIVKSRGHADTRASSPNALSPYSPKHPPVFRLRLRMRASFCSAFSILTAKTAKCPTPEARSQRTSSITSHTTQTHVLQDDSVLTAGRPTLVRIKRRPRKKKT